MANWIWLFFALGTIVCWGAYGPTIHVGTAALKNPWKTILCVGGAYFVIGVLIPSIILFLNKSDWSFSTRGLIYASVGGALGAFGAICIVGAMKNGGRPEIVMPLVFGGAPIVNVLVSMAMHPPERLNIGFLLGVCLTLSGAGMVLYFKPT